MRVEDVKPLKKAATSGKSLTNGKGKAGANKSKKQKKGGDDDDFAASSTAGEDSESPPSSLIDEADEEGFCRDRRRLLRRRPRRRTRQPLRLVLPLRRLLILHSSAQIQDEGQSRAQEGSSDVEADEFGWIRRRREAATQECGEREWWDWGNQDCC